MVIMMPSRAMFNRPYMTCMQDVHYFYKVSPASLQNGPAKGTISFFQTWLQTYLFPFLELFVWRVTCIIKDLPVSIKNDLPVNVQNCGQSISFFQWLQTYLFPFLELFVRWDYVA